MHIFVYGTLLDDELRRRLLGDDVQHAPAALSDHAVRRQSDAPIPAIVPDGGGLVNGQVLLNCSTDTVARLDAYELPFEYDRVTRDVRTADGMISAEVYVAAPSMALSDAPWSMAEWRDSLGPLSREMATEIGAVTPPLDGEALKRQWHMFALRAGVRLRASDDPTPAAVRYTPNVADVEITQQDPLAGSFYKFSGFHLKHRSFQDNTVGPLSREVLIGCDGAIVLPYDPKTDRVLLVEQIRMGPLMRGVPNPWMLEPVAGMIDGGETPHAAALRETQEEAGLEDVTLEEMFSFYASPGSTTDYFYCFAAIGDLPELQTYTGGLEEESEDLRLHVMAFEDAFHLIETGEANVGPLIAMLLWLDRNRDRLRAAA